MQGTDANIYLFVVGDKSQTGKVQLTSSKKNLFERNQNDEFGFESEELGELQKIRIGTY